MKITDPHNPIVMVDDNEDDIFLAQQCLELSDLTNPLRYFLQGRDFVEYMNAVEEHREAIPVLTLLDINMPGMSGFEVLREVRSREDFKLVPVFLMLTNSDNPRDVKKAYELGANGYSNKLSNIDAYIQFFSEMKAY
jgi:CheY-like chemotaxis protein